MKERVLKVMAHHEKGLLTDKEMWQEIVEISCYALNALPKADIGINEGIAR